jgi:hypothetical protein
MLPLTILCNLIPYNFAAPFLAAVDVLCLHHLLMLVNKNKKAGIMSAELRATFGVNVGVAALFPETAAQQCKDDIKAENAGFGSQFTRFTSTKVQILTYEDRPAYV